MYSCMHNAATMKTGSETIAMEMFSLLVPVDPKTVILIVTAKGWYCNICNLSCEFSPHNSMEGHMHHFHEISTTGCSKPEEEGLCKAGNDEAEAQVRDLWTKTSSSLKEGPCLSMQVTDPNIDLSKVLNKNQCWNNENGMSAQTGDAKTSAQELLNAEGEAALIENISAVEEDMHTEDSNGASDEQDRKAEDFDEGNTDNRQAAEHSLTEVTQKNECTADLKETVPTSLLGKRRKQSRKKPKLTCSKKARKDDGQNGGVLTAVQQPRATVVRTRSVLKAAGAKNLSSDACVSDKPQSGLQQMANRKAAKGQKLGLRSSSSSEVLQQQNKMDKQCTVQLKGKAHRIPEKALKTQEMAEHSSKTLAASAVRDLFDQYVDHVVDTASAPSTAQSLANCMNSELRIADTSESRTRTRSKSSKDNPSQTSDDEVSLKLLNLKKEEKTKGLPAGGRAEGDSVGEESEQITAGEKMEGLTAEGVNETELFDSNNLHVCGNKTVMNWPEPDASPQKSDASATESTVENCYRAEVQSPDTAMLCLKPNQSPEVLQFSTKSPNPSLVSLTIHSGEKNFEIDSIALACPASVGISSTTEKNSAGYRILATELNAQSTAESVFKEENGGCCVCKEGRAEDCSVCKEGREAGCGVYDEGREAGCSVCKVGSEADHKVCKERREAEGREDGHSSVLLGTQSPHSGIHTISNSRTAVKAKQCVCDFCNHSFRDTHALQSHLTHYAGQVPVRCKVCQHTFHNLDLLNVHIFFIHEKNESVKPTCLTCNKTIHRRSLPEHIARIHKTSHGLQAFQVRQDSKTVTECPACHTKLLNDHRILEAHARTHAKIEGKLLCQTCRQGFRTNFLLHAHLYAVHNCDKTGRQFHTEMPAEVKSQMILLIQKEQSREPGPQSMRCGICHQDVHDSMHKMLIHLMSHCPRWKLCNSERFYSCPDCGRDVPATSATYHRLTHGHLDSETTKLRCSQCGAAFTSEGNRSRHEHLMHQIDHGSSKQDRRSICEICGKKFVTKQLLRRHVKRHEEETGHFNCDVCSKGFELRSAMEAHRQRHDAQGKSTPCPHCAKKYMSKKALERHVQVEHLHVKDYRFKCDRCPAQYMDSTQLRDHIATKHEGRQPYSCTICFRGFVCRPTLKRHMRRDHREVPNPYVCKVCGERFYEKRYLARHEVTHTGVDPWVCHFCNKSFSCQSTFRSHMDCHKGIRPYLCDHCGMRFLAHKHLERHKERSCAGNKLGPNRYKVKVIEELVGAVS